MLQARPPARPPAAIIQWLWLVAAMVVLIVVVGGVTRLTESGLSITQWKPITGILPPLTETQWQAEFANYRQIPQYEAIHHGMTLAGFKGIFFWEYLHRLLGRLIGTVFAVPLIYFAVRRQIPRGYFWRLVALLALGGLQGAFGWLMVRSGLSDRTEVAPLWLAAHLMTALFTLAGLVWTALDLSTLRRDTRAMPARLGLIGVVVGAVLAVQLFYGALMAGLRAGLVARDWPLMNGRFFPTEVLGSRPFAQLLIDDPGLVHFIHRWWAWVTVAALIVLARRVKPVNRRAAVAIHITFGTQILLGIATVMTGVDIALAALHQLVGALIVVSVTWGVHSIGKTRR
ncbi:COX15/CtaA family protein [Sphingomonas immobilis]|uniref:Heme A synthase n=1 Tax=Sphingomonas immobilis TaxID=3063997 RepID=A0ABT9A092_9SPHN|nr:COX15/CtaA family protein [Sphingomonas sp. CA1-15]MDO7843255.1 COX15/CtaA family protein [Sphingomonas sp. CA1-15]